MQKEAARENGALFIWNVISNTKIRCFPKKCGEILLLLGVHFSKRNSKASKQTYIHIEKGKRTAQ